MNLETDLPGKSPDIVINTSCEHFENDNWIQQIPPGVMVIAQSTDMPHPTHNNGNKNLEDFRMRLALGEILDADRLYFLYEKLSFFRFMIIGLKGQE